MPTSMPCALDLARRLADIIAAAKAAPSADTYVRLGEASRQLGMSRKTLKKWTRGDLVRDAMQLPGGNDVRVARARSNGSATTPSTASRPRPSMTMRNPWR